MIAIFTAMSILGAICVSRGKSLAANGVWAISNIGLAWYNISISEYEMAFLFGVYEVIAVYGVFNLLYANRNRQ